jgi:hypothetical protein
VLRAARKARADEFAMNFEGASVVLRNLFSSRERTSEKSITGQFMNKTLGTGPIEPGRAGGDGRFAGSAMRPTRWGKPGEGLGDWTAGERQKGRGLEPGARPPARTVMLASKKAGAPIRED